VEEPFHSLEGVVDGADVQIDWEQAIGGDDVVVVAKAGHRIAWVTMHDVSLRMVLSEERPNGDEHYHQIH
jgi:hypothetical protein